MASSGCVLKSGLLRFADGFWPKGVGEKNVPGRLVCGWSTVGDGREATWEGCVWAKDGGGQSTCSAHLDSQFPKVTAESATGFLCHPLVCHR